MGADTARNISSVSDEKSYGGSQIQKQIISVEFVGCTVMPQCYSAVAENLKDFKGITLLADIGNGTMNLMYLNNGRPMESKAWTEKLGVFQCYQKIHNLVQDNTGECLMEEVIESFLRTGETDLPEKYAELMKQATVTYTEEIMQKLQDHEFNGELMRVYFMGGGARLVEQFGKYNQSEPFSTTIFGQTQKDMSITVICCSVIRIRESR